MLNNTYKLIRTYPYKKIQTCRPLLICLLIGVFGSGIVKADDYFWVGGTGNWSDFASHWVKTSGGASFHIAAPTPSDNVYFDANSFSSVGQTVTVDVTTASCKDMDWAGSTNSPTLETSSNSNSLKIYGSLLLIPAMTFNFDGAIYFEATTSGHTITFASHIIPGYKEIYFNSASGEWTLQDSLSAAAREIYLVAGVLNTNNQNITCLSFLSGVSNVRTLNLGSSIIRLKGWDWYFYNTSNFTFNAGTSTIISYKTGGFHFTGGDFSYHKVIFAENAKIQYSGNTFDTLILTPGRTYTLDDGKTQTINNYLDANGSCSSSIIIESDAPGSQATISKASGAITLDYVSLKDIEATGGATFTANSSSS